MSKKEAILELAGIDVCYGNVQVLFDLNLRVEQGELVCLLGGNASGKSTTLKTILGICRPVRGSIQMRMRLHISISF